MRMRRTRRGNMDMRFGEMERRREMLMLWLSVFFFGFFGFSHQCHVQVDDATSGRLVASVSAGLSGLLGENRELSILSMPAFFFFFFQFLNLRDLVLKDL